MAVDESNVIIASPTQTDDLAKFVKKTTQKRNCYMQKRYRDLRVEAILEATLRKTRTELDNRRKMRKDRWRSMKSNWMLVRSENNDWWRNTVGVTGAAAVAWTPDENGQWCDLNKSIAQDDLFNLNEFFNDIDSVIYQNQRKSA